jgi:predicted lysophospholipase L1 biosynthesis ABC-type transport system permease subunit
MRRQQEPIMIVSFRTLRQSVLAIACIAAVTTLASRASYAFSAEAQQMCTGDAFRLCSSEIPNIPAVTACMIKRKSELSSGCRAVFDREVSKKSGKVADAD